MKGYLTTQQVCDLYHITRPTLWRWAMKGKIRQFKDPKSRYTYYLPIKSNILCVKEVCDRLKISRTTLYNYVTAGRIMQIPGQRGKFTEEEIIRFEAEQRANLMEIPPVVDIMEGFKK